jgi:hypothetical protein
MAYSMDSEINVAEVESPAVDPVIELLKLMLNFLSFKCLKFSGDMKQKEVLNSDLCEISRRLGSGFVPDISLPKNVKLGTNPPHVNKQTTLNDRIWYLRRSQFLLHLFLAQ